MHDVIYFVSDLHLGSREDHAGGATQKKFLNFLGHIEKDASALYIVGDLFDFWFEYKHVIPKVSLEVLLALRQLTGKGIALTLFFGNHDPWQIDYLQTQLPAAVIPWDMTVEAQGKKIYLCHGDGLAPSDRGYRLLKKILRNKINVALYRLLPCDWAIPLARRVAGASRNYTTERGKNFLPEYEAFAQKKLNEGYDAVILGHAHEPVEKKWGGKAYLNLGDWLTHFTYAELRHGTLRLKRF